jgi:predicted DNA binding protein
MALSEELTPRQMEAIQTAYFSGYFERPRDRTASEVADAMDISQPTFTHHLRTAQRKLCRELFERDRTSR